MKERLESLFHYLGSPDEVIRIMRVFYAEMAKDPMIGFFFSGRDLNSIADKQSEFLLRAMGQTQSYRGKSPAQAHHSLAPILPGHFDRRAIILRDTLRAQGLPEAHIQTWMEFEATFRESVINRAQ